MKDFDNVSDISVNCRGATLAQSFANLFQVLFGQMGRNWLPKVYKNSPVPLLLALSYWAILYALNGLAPSSVYVCLLMLVLYYWKRETRQFLFFLFPFALAGIIYDSMRFYVDYIRGYIHVVEPYHLEKALFGITMASGNILTPNEFLQGYIHPIADLFCGFAYLVYFFEYILLGIYFYFAGLWGFFRRSGWGFFVVNMIGYATYYIYPAAPPWYVAKYGMGPADLTAPADPAGAARFDQILGTHFFDAFYGSSANIFGAIPSLHVAYPFLAFLFSLQLKRFRLFSAWFSALVCFAAVYLNHHYIIDVILGLLYSFLTFVFVNWFFKGKKLNADKLIEFGKSN